MNKLFLFPNSKARDFYIYKENGDNYSLDITNYKTIYEFYKSNINNFFKNYSIEKNITSIEKSIAIINMHSAIIEFTNKNKNSILSKQTITYELASNLYSFLEEITFAEFISREELDLSNNKHIKDIKQIIEIYKNKNYENIFLDEFDIFIEFINAIKNKQIKTFKDYETIYIYNFESLPPIYNIFLEELKNNYNIDINILLPNECKNKFKPYFKIYNIETYEISNFAKALITQGEIDNFKENIKLITAFGCKQEVDTVLDEIIKLTNCSNIYLDDIVIIYSDAEKYYDYITSRLKECNIKFNERRGNFIWKTPFIPVLMSIFNVLEKKSYNEININVDNLIKILSSPYINNIENINNYNIRNILYSDKDIVSVMNIEDFIKKMKDNESILKFIELLKKLIDSKTYKKIADTYIEILKFLKVDLIFEDTALYNENNNLLEIHRDSLILFIELILKLASIDYYDEINYYDFYSTLSSLIEESYIKTNKNKSEAITLTNLYDARGIKAKYLFILGMNNDFINRKPNSFIISNKIRDSINNKYKKNILNTQAILSDMYYNLFLNILSSIEDDDKIYFSFRFKDDDGNLEIPFYYIEEIALKLGIKDFKLNDGFVYRKEYIPSNDSIHTQKENTMSLFFERENYKPLVDKYLNNNNKLPDNLEDIIESVHKKINKNVSYENNKANNAIQIIKNKLLSKNGVSVSYLLNIMQCPAKVLYSNECQVEAISSEVSGIDKILKGSIYHEIFYNFYDKIKNKYNNNLELKISEFDNYNDIAKEVIKDTIYTSYKNEITQDIDKKIMEHEISNIMNHFIKNEIEDIESYGFIPFKLEKSFDNVIVYSYKNFNIKIKGRIDRIDLSYREDKTINGIRIIDYKGSEYNIKEIKSDDNNYDDIINNYLQPLLYLKYAIDEYIVKQNPNIDIFKQLEKCELGFNIYKEKNIVNKEKHYIKFNDKETLLTILGYNGKNILNDYFDKVLKYIIDGELIFIPGENQCRDCMYYNLCSEHYVYE